MSETELSVICKNCGSEVSPYVTECPYCGARLRKRAPKLERRGDALEARPQAPRRRACAAGCGAVPRAPSPSAPTRPGPRSELSALLLIVQKATGATLAEVGGLEVPFDDQWWRLFTAPFAYVDVGYLFVVAIALVIFAGGARAAPRQLRRRGPADRLRRARDAGRRPASPKRKAVSR